MAFRASLGEAVLRLGVDSAEFKKGLDQAEKRALNMGRSLQSIGRSMRNYVTLPLAGAAAAAVKVSADFETAMLRVEGVTGATGQTLVALQEQAKELGVTTQHSAKAAAEGMTFLAMAGLDVQQIMGSLPATLSLATAGQMDLGQAADVASNIMTAFKLKASDMDMVVDQLAGAFMSSNTSMIQMAEAMKYGGPVAASLGNDVADVAAIIGTFGNAGIQASMAGTTLRQMLAQLAAPTAKLQKHLDELGISLKDADGKMLGIVEIVQTFEEAGVKAADAFEILGVRAGTGLAVALSAGSKAIQDLEDTIRSSDGAAKQLADTLLKGLKGHWDLMTSAMTGFAIAVTESGLGDLLKGIMDRLRALFQWASELPKPLLLVGTAFAGLAAIVGPGLMMYGTLLSLFTKLTAAGAPMAAGIGLVKTAMMGLGSVMFGPAGAIAAVAALAFGYNQLRIAKDNLRIADLANEIRQTDEPLKEARRKLSEVAHELVRVKDAQGAAFGLGAIASLAKNSEKVGDLQREYDALIDLVQELMDAQKKAAKAEEDARIAAEVAEAQREAAARKAQEDLKEETRLMRLKEFQAKSALDLLLEGYRAVEAEERKMAEFRQRLLDNLAHWRMPTWIGGGPGSRATVSAGLETGGSHSFRGFFIPDRSALIAEFGDVTAQGMKEAERIAKRMSKDLAKALVDGQDIISSIANSIQAGIARVISEGVGERLAGSLSKAFSNSKIFDIFGGKGDAIAGVLGGAAGGLLGGLAGGAVGWLGGKIGGWLGFGGNDEEKARAAAERAAAQARIDAYNQQQAEKEEEARRKLIAAMEEEERKKREAAERYERLNNKVQGAIQAFVDTRIVTMEFALALTAMPEDLASAFNAKLAELDTAREQLGVLGKLKSGIQGDLPDDAVETFLKTGQVTDELLEAAKASGLEIEKLEEYAGAKNKFQAFEQAVKDLNNAEKGSKAWREQLAKVRDMIKDAGVKEEDLNKAILKTSNLMKGDLQTAAKALDSTLDTAMQTLRQHIANLGTELEDIIRRIGQAFADMAAERDRMLQEAGTPTPPPAPEDPKPPAPLGPGGSGGEGSGDPNAPGSLSPTIIINDPGPNTEVEVHDGDELIATSLGNSWDENTSGVRDRIGA